MEPSSKSKPISVFTVPTNERSQKPEISTQGSFKSRDGSAAWWILRQRYNLYRSKGTVASSWPWDVKDGTGLAVRYLLCYLSSSRRIPELPIGGDGREDIQSVGLGVAPTVADVQRRCERKSLARPVHFRANGVSSSDDGSERTPP